MKALSPFLCGLAAAALAVRLGYSQAPPMDVSLAPALRAASNSPSVFLNPMQRAAVVATFIQFVQIRSPSQHEEQFQRELRRRLAATGAREVACGQDDAQAPCNLVMEFVATPGLADRPAILLNAHIDTIAGCLPEGMRFDAGQGDFYHTNETTRGKSSSFGGDDKSAVAVIVEALRVLQARFWDRGVGHRRILALFTASEETGCVGASYLSTRCPQLFDNVAITLAIDGPLDFHTDYPWESFVLVVAKPDALEAPYKRVLDLTDRMCRQHGKAFGTTETGLGMGDFAHFPASAHAGLHVRSPVRGFHRNERVKIQDLINHVDLLCHLLLGWDDPLSKAPAP